MASKTTSWSDMPQEILPLIFDCCKDPTDILRCGAACKSWLQIALQVHPKCFILIGEDGSLILLNILTKETRKIQVPETKGQWIYSYSNSWLFIVDSDPSVGGKLLNVFSRTQIDSPPFTSSRSPKTSSYVSTSRPLNWKLLLSKSPLDPDCLVFLLGDSSERYASERFGAISSWKPGEERWSDWKIFNFRIYDAILYKGKLYATIKDSSDGNFLIITFNYQLEIEAKVRIPETFQKYSNGRHFLVKSPNDDCLLVGDFDGIFHEVKPKEVFEFDVCAKEFREVNDLGGYALFLGPNHFLAKARSCETWFKANCIYFLRERERNFIVYDLGTRRLYTCQSFGEKEKNYYGRHLGLFGCLKHLSKWS